MSGGNRDLGSVAGLTGFRNPISVARAVMEHSDFAMLIGKGAEEFALLRNLPKEQAEYFETELRKSQLEEAKAHDRAQLDHAPADSKFGTVGAVALDQNGELAAATSTGGITNKRFGRVGDSPIAGAGVFADDTVAVSCTGWGEYYLRSVTAFHVSTLMRYANLNLEEATLKANQDALSLGGGGGLIAVDKAGNVSLPFNTEGMYRAWANHSGTSDVAIFK